MFSDVVSAAEAATRRAGNLRSVAATKASRGQGVLPRPARCFIWGLRRLGRKPFSWGCSPPSFAKRDWLHYTSGPPARTIRGNTYFWEKSGSERTPYVCESPRDCGSSRLTVRGHQRTGFVPAAGGSMRARRTNAGPGSALRLYFVRLLRRCSLAMSTIRPSFSTYTGVPALRYAGRDPASRGKNSRAKVVFPAPLGPAMITIFLLLFIWRAAFDRGLSVPGL